MRRALPLVGLILVYVKIVLTAAHLAPLDSDEGMYSGAAWCVASGHTLYSDVVFTQTPGAAWLYAGLIKTFGYSLLGMRVLNGLFVLAVPVLAAILVQRHAVGDANLRRRAGLVAFVLIAFSDLFLNYNITARNYAPALCWALAATLLALETRNSTRFRREALLTLAAGLCLGLAVTFKHSMVVIFPPLFWFMAAERGNGYEVGGSSKAIGQTPRPSTVRTWGGFLFGLIVGLWPTLWTALRAPDAFVFGTYGIHQLIVAWRIETHHPGTGWPNKTWIWLGLLVRESWVITAPALVALIASLILRLNRRQNVESPGGASTNTSRRSTGLFGMAAFEAGSLAALYFWLTPTWPDYATQVLPFLAVAAAVGLVRLLAPRPATIALMAIAILAVATNPHSLDRLLTRRLNHPNQLTRLEACGAWLREHVRPDEEVLCVFPPYLLAADRDPTFELAGGITAMNVADRLPLQRRRDWRVMSQEEMLERTRKGAYEWVVTGTTTPARLTEYLAGSADWRLAAYWSGGLAAYMRLQGSNRRAGSVAPPFIQPQ